MKDYTYVDFFDGKVKSCTREEANELVLWEEFYIITPDGDWLVGPDQVQAVERS